VPRVCLFGTSSSPPLANPSICLQFDRCVGIRWPAPVLSPGIFFSRTFGRSGVSLPHSHGDSGGPMMGRPPYQGPREEDPQRQDRGYAQFVSTAELTDNVRRWIQPGRSVSVRSRGHIPGALAESAGHPCVQRAGTRSRSPRQESPSAQAVMGWANPRDREGKSGCRARDGMGRRGGWAPGMCPLERTDTRATSTQPPKTGETRGQEGTNERGQTPRRMFHVEHINLFTYNNYILRGH
jgi:hypothetical protein